MDLHVAFSRPTVIGAIDIAVGRQLKRLRERLDFSTATMSKRLSISEYELRAIEEGGSRASVSLLIAANIAFRVPASYFYEGLSRVAATQ